MSLTVSMPCLEKFDRAFIFENCFKGRKLQKQSPLLQAISDYINRNLPYNPVFDASLNKLFCYSGIWPIAIIGDKDGRLKIAGCDEDGNDLLEASLELADPTFFENLENLLNWFATLGR